MDEKTLKIIENLMERDNMQSDRITLISQRLDIVVERLDRIEKGVNNG